MPEVSDRSTPEHRLKAILLLIFYFPAGLPYMWLTRPFRRKTQRIITACFLIAILLGFLMIIVWTTSPGYLY